LQQPFGSAYLRDEASRKGEAVETVQQLLGHAHLDHTDAYLDVDVKVLEEMFSTAL
jgi:site-specific recombinase XerD